MVHRSLKRTFFLIDVIVLKTFGSFCFDCLNRVRLISVNFNGDISNNSTLFDINSSLLEVLKVKRIT